MGGCQSLHQVVRQGSLESLRATCARARDMNMTEQVESLQRWSAVQLAAWLGKEEAIEILADFGANVNFTDDNGSTALHLAASAGHVDALRALLMAGAEINAIDRNGMTSLHVAALDGHDEVVKFLCLRQADVNRPDTQGATALHLACYEGHLIVVYLLLNHGASVMVVDRKGNTPLHDAASGGNSVIMHRLLRHGADLAYRNQNNETAEQIYERLHPIPPMTEDLEDSESTNASDTMPSTPPKHDPSFAGCSSIDACSLSGTEDDADLSMGEVTSSWVGGPVSETLLAIRATREDLAARMSMSLEQMDVDPEPYSPRRVRRSGPNRSDFTL